MDRGTFLKLKTLEEISEIVESGKPFPMTKFISIKAQLDNLNTMLGKAGYVPETWKDDPRCKDLTEAEVDPKVQTFKVTLWKTPYKTLVLQQVLMVSYCAGDEAVYVTYDPRAAAGDDQHEDYDLNDFAFVDVEPDD